MQNRLNRRTRWRRALARVGGVLGCLAGLGASADALPDELDPDALRPLQKAEAPYASSDRCRSCHPGPYASWHASFHRTMTQIASPEMALGDFGNVEATAYGQRYRMFERDGQLWAELGDPEWDDRDEPAPRVERPAVLTTGSHHMQIYWLASGNGREIFTLPVAHDVELDRWFPTDANFLAPPHPHDLGSQIPLGTWNHSCIRCHATGGQPRLDRETGWDTRAAEFGIACEACHGGAAAHASSERDPLQRYAAYLAGGEDAATDVVNPARLPKAVGAEVCGRCHSVWGFRTKDEQERFMTKGIAYEPGGSLREAGVHVVSEGGHDPGAFWSDGMVRTSGREYNGLIKSPCYERGELDCFSCHRMHQDASDPRPLEEWRDDQLEVGMRGNRACSGCHGAIASALGEHTHHRPASSGSECMNCHMPHTSLGLRKAARSHQIDSPTAGADLATGRLNACNACHLDRSIGWTADQLSAWYGQERPELDAIDERVAAAVVDALRGDAAQRALIAWHLGWKPAVAASGASRWAPFLLAELLTDPYEAVRYMAHRSLRRAPGYEGFAFDFVAASDERNARAAEVVERWIASGGSGALLGELLDNQDGALGPGVMTQLRADRDHTPVTIRE